MPKGIHEPALARFERFFIPEPNSGCFLWFGATGGNGYGKFNIVHTRQEWAHRAAYILLVGPIPEGKQICHRCDNRSCVNPEHMFLGDQSDNMQDCWDKKRHPGHHLHGEATKMAAISNETARIISLSSGTNVEIAKRYQVSVHTVSNIRSGRGWKFLGAPVRRRPSRDRSLPRISSQDAAYIKAVPNWRYGMTAFISKRLGVTEGMVYRVRYGKTHRNVLPHPDGAEAERLLGILDAPSRASGSKGQT